MNKLHRTFYMILLLTFIKSYALTWNDYLALDDSNITVEQAATQCMLSGYYAPQKQLDWCNKAYSMGHWQSLYELSKVTGDSEKLLFELQNRLNNNDAMAYLMMASLYQEGEFVNQDTNNAIELYHQLLLLNTRSANNLRCNVNLKLAKIYNRIEDWDLLKKHADNAIEHCASPLHQSYASSYLKMVKLAKMSKN